MSGINHRRVYTNGIWMHIAEKGQEGQGPLVLLIHGFPQLWSCWSHQISSLAEHGFHVVAPDLRGYGDSDCPPDPSSYTLLHIVGDLIGLLDELRHKQNFVPGNTDATNFAHSLIHRVKALVNLGVPYRPRSPEMKPLQFMTKVFGEGLYISQFQEPGRAEKSFSKHDCLTILKKFLLLNGPDPLVAPPGVEIIDFLETPSSLPPWISEDELQFCASKFQKSGFTGGLNYYRAMDMNWELLGAWQGAKITVPTKLIVGDKDLGFQSFGTKAYIEGQQFKNLVPDVEVIVIDGHHFIHQEKAEQVTLEILSFFKNISPA
ncbi:hypothetical protein TIFTF001_024857 [Ficus carica]|uniref:soluble epoxide hydrolase n=1 Tax=Ficus carica TaxID=3494 RepID=A0AA88DH21_FICCA|nr:hypothetical protein TIFTF001_024857 [Ficus carica]